jgi:hypothetical protein
MSQFNKENFPEEFETLQLIFDAEIITKVFESIFLKFHIPSMNKVFEKLKKYNMSIDKIKLLASEINFTADLFFFIGSFVDEPLCNEHQIQIKNTFEHYQNVSSQDIRETLEFSNKNTDIGDKFLKPLTKQTFWIIFYYYKRFLFSFVKYNQENSKLIDQMEDKDPVQNLLSLRKKTIEYIVDILCYGTDSIEDLKQTISDYNSEIKNLIELFNGKLLKDSISRDINLNIALISFKELFHFDGDFLKSEINEKMLIEQIRKQQLKKPIKNLLQSQQQNKYEIKTSKPSQLKIKNSSIKSSQKIIEEKSKLGDYLINYILKNNIDADTTSLTLTQYFDFIQWLFSKKNISITNPVRNSLKQGYKSNISQTDIHLIDERKKLYLYDIATATNKSRCSFSNLLYFYPSIYESDNDDSTTKKSKFILLNPEQSPSHQFIKTCYNITDQFIYNIFRSIVYIEHIHLETQPIPSKCLTSSKWKTLSFLQRQLYLCFPINLIEYKDVITPFLSESYSIASYHYFNMEYFTIQTIAFPHHYISVKPFSQIHPHHKNKLGEKPFEGQHSFQKEISSLFDKDGILNYVLHNLPIKEHRQISSDQQYYNSFFNSLQQFYTCDIRPLLSQETKTTEILPTKEIIQTKKRKQFESRNFQTENTDITLLIRDHELFSFFGSLYLLTKSWFNIYESTGNFNITLNDYDTIVTSTKKRKTKAKYNSPSSSLSLLPSSSSSSPPLTHAKTFVQPFYVSFSSTPKFPPILSLFEKENLSHLSIILIDIDDPQYNQLFHTICTIEDNNTLHVLDLLNSSLPYFVYRTLFHFHILYTSSKHPVYNQCVHHFISIQRHFQQIDYSPSIPPPFTKEEVLQKISLFLQT